MSKPRPAQRGRSEGCGWLGATGWGRDQRSTQLEAELYRRANRRNLRFLAAQSMASSTAATSTATEAAAAGSHAAVAAAWSAECVGCAAAGCAARERASASSRRSARILLCMAELWRERGEGGEKQRERERRERREIR